MGFQQRLEKVVSALDWGLVWPLFAAPRVVSEMVGWRLARLRRFILVVLIYACYIVFIFTVSFWFVLQRFVLIVTESPALKEVIIRRGGGCPSRLPAGEFEATRETLFSFFSLLFGKIVCV